MDATAPDPGVLVLRRGDPGFPPRLLDLAAPPDVLHVRGDPACVARAIAIVGSRAATPYGLAVARTLAADLARLGWCVVSGLARGVDAAAHEGALAAGGASAAVLPGPLDRVTPRPHEPLARAIAARGAVLTERPPGAPVHRGSFLERNRLIAALAAAVVVVEAAARSGALSTAASARRLGRPVLAVPGDVDRETSRGTNALIACGAIPCLGAADAVRAAGRPPAPADAGPESRLLGALGPDPLPAETLARRAGVALEDALAALTALEWAGAASAHAGARWSLPAA